ncbi:alpha-2-macroglobulin family protein [Chryseobacterium arthrosphaerae]|uniref:alpha-2-macroglobulin family protein n=1 Tax=Chryseobacterium arthrosphaerae TaxID=651561 RepID=UPI001F4AE1F8|nr:MG2 domain-containing protein [Chryseobacterium arthrosphaerae]
MKIISKSVLLFFAFLCIISHAQAFYEEQWKKIAESYQNGTFKSNLPLILEIQNKAVAEGNTTEIIRSLKAEFAVYKDTQDDPKNDYASVFFSKISNMNKRLKNDDLLFFKVLEVEFFENYYDLKKWDIESRTNLAEGDLSEIEEWTKLDFKNFYLKRFAELTTSEDKLRKISMEKYKDAFENERDFQFFPTLYDWKVKKNIDFLNNGYIFTKDELKENQTAILALYQNLIDFNTGNSKLYFQHQKLIYENTAKKDEKFLEKQIALVNSSIKGDYKILIVRDAVQELRRQSKFIQAVELIDKMKKEYPGSKFLTNITQQEKQIKATSVSLFFETHNEPGKPIQIVADHKNADHFVLKIYKINDVVKQLKYLNYFGYGQQYFSNEEYSKIDKTLVRTDTFTLPNKKDYFEYSTALEVEELPKGMYLGEYINGEEVSKFMFIVTSSSVVYNENKDYILVDRETGKLKPNTKLFKYDFRDYSGIDETELMIATDNLARFTSEKIEYHTYRYLYYDPAANDYNIVISPYFARSYDYYYPHTQFFLDRQIFRPGQTVYFKGISTYPDKEKKKEILIINNEQTVTLYDANSQVISSRKFTTNAFGAYNGSFVLPKDKLNGHFRIEVSGYYGANSVLGSKYFSVEEYKRPKFEITFDTIRKDYKYGETIELKGKVVTFSGIPLSNTNVNYEIKRENIRQRYFWWYPYDYSNENSILGKAETNEKGEFVIKIDLKKDENKEGIQVHNYKIKTSATDINGETQAAETDVKVASVSHYLKSDEIKETFAEDELKINVTAFNYNDISVNKNYKVKLVQLKEAGRVLRNNFEQKVQNLPVMSRNEFLKKFPHDRYDQSETLKNREILKTIIEDTKEGKELNLGKLDPGNYRLLVYNVEGKDTIKVEQEFNVWSKKRLGKNQYPFLKVVGPKGEVVRGSQAVVYAYSAIPDAFVNIYLQDGQGKKTMERKKFTNGVLAYTFPVSGEKNITKYNVQFVLASYNDVQNQYAHMSVRNEKDPLKIELTTFRDKVEPGSKEKWSVRISGRNKEKVVAEVLANMYDKSLDKFVPNTYSFEKTIIPVNVIEDYNIRNLTQTLQYDQKVKYEETKGVYIPKFDWFDKNVFYQLMLKYGLTVDTDGDGVDDMRDACPTVPGLESYEGCPKPKAMIAAEVSSERSERGRFDNDGIKDKEDKKEAAPEKQKEDLKEVKARQNLNETAFFYPDLKTDAHGNISFEFTTPEALTKWKLMFLAHTADLRTAVLEKDIITQKKLSVNPNYPRFLREGDELNFQTKISNLTDKAMSGAASLQILNAETNEDISQQFGISSAVQNFDVKDTGNSVVSWKIKTPFSKASSIIIKVVAKAGEYSDGEQIPVAVLSNRMMLTDAVPIFVKEGQTKTFTLQNLKNNTSETVENISNTLELKTNPVWEILFALPDLSTHLNITSDAIFNTWFADVVGTEIFKANPRMKAVFDEYKSADLLKSNLEKNQELKQVLLEETPWVLNAKSETETMNRISRLFEVNAMKASINSDWKVLLQYQNGDGGFPWLPGFRSSYVSSLYILRNLGKMNDWLKGGIAEYQSGQNNMVSALIQYIDNELNTHWKENEDTPWSNFALDYLDARRYWEKEYPLKGTGANLKKAIITRADKFKITDFTFFGLHRAALIYNSYGLKAPSEKLIRYLKETSVSSETQGAYWKQNLNDWGWYESKAVNHAGAIEAINKVTPEDVNFIEESKVWLATQKETNSWGNSRTTAEIIYIFMNSGKSWTTPEADKATIIWGGQEVAPQTKTTGYLKQAVYSDKVNKKLGEVTVTKPGPGIAQGGLFWQYYENLENVKPTETYLSMTREYYKKIKTTNGEELVKITENSPLTVGDQITVRMILNTDRPMQYVHLKDMRAAGLEPVDVLSGYQYKNNLGYYQATKDASTNFYIYYMPKGKYVFEYDLVCNASGIFSSGFATLQNYYAPQMNARTKGDQLEIKK